MKFIQRLTILGFVAITVSIISLIYLLALNPLVCRIPQEGGDGLDGPVSPGRLVADEGGGVDPRKLEEEKFIEKLREIASHKSEVYKQRAGDKSEPVWDKIITPQKSRDRYLIPFHMLADQRQLYGESPRDQKILEKLINSLSTSPIVDVAELETGTQIKLNFTLADGTRALFKPGRFPRDATANPNHFYFSDMERHVSEIAAHHLDRLLGFRRVPPCAGRMVNLTHDIKRLADFELHKTFFISPAGNTCFMSHCDYYCDSAHAICGSPELIEGSMCVYLPDSRYAPREKIRHPWRRSYSKHRRAEWETDDLYCQNVTSRPLYAENQRRLLDLIDMAVFDFFISNLDRHHYETFEFEGDGAFTIVLDNGKGFGQPNQDEPSILAPLYQCCSIRLSTLTTLLRYHSQPNGLGAAMRSSLARDRLPRVLTEAHLRALDRRLRKVLLTVYECLQEGPRTDSYIDSVLISDDL